MKVRPAMGPWDYIVTGMSLLVGDGESAMGAWTGQGRCRYDTFIHTLVGNTPAGEIDNARGGSTNRAGTRKWGWGRRQRADNYGGSVGTRGIAWTTWA